MRRIYSILLAVGAMSLAIGCTVESTSKPAPSTNEGGPYTPAPNGVAIDELKACELMVGYMEKTAKKYNCKVAAVTCPDYLRQSDAPKCSQYDEGSVKGCEAHFASLQSCDDIGSRPCRIRYIENSAPKGCTEEADAGLTDSDTQDSQVESDADDKGDSNPVVDADPDNNDSEPEIDADTENDGGDTLDAGPDDKDSEPESDADPENDGGEDPDAETP